MKNLYFLCAFITALSTSCIVGLSTAFGAESQENKHSDEDPRLSLKVQVIEYKLLGYRLFRKNRPPYKADILVGRVTNEGKLKERIFHFLISEAQRPKDAMRLLEAEVSVFSSVIEREVFTGDGYNETYPVNALTGLIWR